MQSRVERSAVSNRTVAKDLGLDKPTVSRLRSGIRKPSIYMIARIRNTYGWQPNEQIIAYEGNVWRDEFEQALENHYFGRKNRKHQAYSAQEYDGIDNRSSGAGGM